MKPSKSDTQYPKTLALYYRKIQCHERKSSLHNVHNMKPSANGRETHGSTSEGDCCSACSIAVLCLFIYCITLLYDTIWCQCNDFVIVGASFVRSFTLSFSLFSSFSCYAAMEKAHKRFSALFYWCGGVVVVVMPFIRILSFFLKTDRHKGEMPFLLTLSMTTSFRSYNLFFLCFLFCTLTAVGVMRIYIYFFSLYNMLHIQPPTPNESGNSDSESESMRRGDGEGTHFNRLECLVGIWAMKTNFRVEPCCLRARKTKD